MIPDRVCADVSAVIATQVASFDALQSIQTDARSPRIIESPSRNRETRWAATASSVARVGWVERTRVTHHRCSSRRLGRQAQHPWFISHRERSKFNGTWGSWALQPKPTRADQSGAQLRRAAADRGQGDRRSPRAHPADSKRAAGGRGPARLLLALCSHRLQRQPQACRADRRSGADRLARGGEGATLLAGSGFPASAARHRR